MKLIKVAFILIINLIGIVVMNAQGHLISGTVVDIDGVPLPGVTVLEKDTSNGVVTDLDGKYVMTSSTSSSTLVFSYLGFETKLVNLENRRSLDVILSENIESLEEVQVVAFQKQKRTVSLGQLIQSSLKNLSCQVQI